MRFSPFRRWPLGVGVALLLASCNVQKAKVSASSSDGEPVPLALAQALVLSTELSIGGISPQNAEDYRFASEMVYDLSGKPMYYLILSGPNVRDFWSTILNPGEGDYSLWTVGATDKRNFFEKVLPASSFEAIAETRAKAGSFKRFLSSPTGALYLEDESGRVWDVFSRSEVDPGQFELERKLQQDIIRQRQADGLLDELKKAWDDLRQKASQKISPQGLGLPSLEEVTLPDGQLNVPKVIRALETLRVTQGISPAYVNERSWCSGRIWWFCWGNAYASVVRKNRYSGDLANDRLYNPNNPEDESDCPYGPKCQIARSIREGDPLGNRQYITSYRLEPPFTKADGTEDKNGFWGAWDFGPSGLVPLNVVGCGPMSIVRLFNWYTNKRQFYNSHNVELVVIPDNLPDEIKNREDKDKVAYVMFDPVPIGTTKDGKTVYQPRIGVYASTWHLVGQGMTRDTNMVPAANRWIQERASAEGKNWEMRGYSQALVQPLELITLPISWWIWTQHTWNVRDIVRGKIGRDNEPVIILYGLNGMGEPFVGHYAMSQAYIVHENPFFATVLAWIRRESKDPLEGSYVNITDLFSLYSGAYGLYRR